MPYIPQDERDKVLNYGVEAYDMTPGQHNFLLTSLLNAWLGPNPSYHNYEQVLGRLEAVKLEIWRRRMVQYEDQKKTQHGDIDGFSSIPNSTGTIAGSVGHNQGVLFSGTAEMGGTDS